MTANASLDWESLLGALAPNGWLHVVGAVPEPIPFSAFSLILAQKSHFPMSRVNEAIERLEAGKARYRIILDADF